MTKLIEPNNAPRIVVTGACGFIGSCLINKLNSEKFENIIAVDVFDNPIKLSYLVNSKIEKQIHRDDFFDWFDENVNSVDYVIHLGAISDTTENNIELLKKYNTNYSEKLWTKCSSHNIPIIIASSAATYGNGEYGYSDEENLIPLLQPLNLYGISKNDFDKWSLVQENKPPHWYSLKFFNVYGPNEFHKGKMASVVLHSYNQIQSCGKVCLFKSENINFKDGEQLRDFIYVDDVLDVILWFMKSKPKNGIYNVGTGKSRSFFDLAKAVFSALNLKPNISFIDMPTYLVEKYQYFTEAKTEKLIQAGYNKKMTELEDGVRKYVEKLNDYYD
ncbi:ADP-glyceromanno-heptose 6-epimerase [Bacteroidales bacterium OttesenSCG-928-K22]|nr:ADP-glyceromanno-heptose 6-epimerase [Bacteroidales bacterium OttesenSCG-928-L14]MDL2240609.1 ADP-glyceromanno-heptose 6-epimerase [Bacteroidales bacterium OttesenSCG-928-K22]